MKTKVKNVYKGESLYRLIYRLEKVQNGFKLMIREEEYDAVKFRMKKGTPPRFSEESTVVLDSISEEEACIFFNELSENLVFPCSLTYILEDCFN